jgi:hypothetical protein
MAGWGMNNLPVDEEPQISHNAMRHDIGIRNAAWVIFVKRDVGSALRNGTIAVNFWT